MPDIKKLCNGLSGDPKAVARNYYELTQIVTRAAAPDSGDRDEVAQALAAELNARTPSEKDDKGNEKGNKIVYNAGSRRLICRLLSLVAEPEQLPALAEVINDFDIRDMALFAMERIPGDEATRRIVNAFNDQVGPVFRVGVVNSLAKRNGDQTMEALKTAASDEDEDVRLAAVEALSNFPDAECDQMIAAATREGSPMAVTRALRARVRLAETLSRAGKTSDAKRIYKAILDGNGHPAQKKAAQIGLDAIG